MDWKKLAKSALSSAQEKIQTEHDKMERTSYHAQRMTDEELIRRTRYGSWGEKAAYYKELEARGIKPRSKM
ncbi:hypothetical protein [Turicibacter sanguinis]|uniref:hypothetical protein n=1 Tax=Turicibacter sanguinis TaxID=154288 RepID=UPI00241CE7F5|nr:hypothetical protein [Turicibacter sanguinis]